MPIREDDIEQNDWRIYFEKPGQVSALVGPCIASSLRDELIPLDGRHYKCAGKLIFKNGLEVRANFRIQTHTFDFLERDSVWCYIDGVWYQIEEAELYDVLGIKPEEALPYTWLPDRLLDYHEQGPYPMDWYESIRENSV